MISNDLKYFNWCDIQKEICKEMVIDEVYFRDYHKVVGGDYKDLWHEWINYFQSSTGGINDTIKYSDIGESFDSKLSWILEDNKEWLVPFVISVYKIWDKYGIEYVRYSW